ncbi:PDZ domain-containing protein [Viridibacillus sp. YIM B01967]|uniref:PDZ domain-containing protein n=1 Tax=Viridibacillus soli TaxID=2798301 RepID=A0ABS1H5P8_9BACL|nr:S41 family peptidase [Viridibacillus soli]MBK3494743.1 PDZ domain-containing protein [Viridibacillus soli]
MKKLRIYVLGLIALFAFFTTSVAYAAEPLDEAKELVEKYYYPNISKTALNSNSIQEMTSQLDPYSVYMTKDEYEEFANAIDMKLVGIGVTLEEDPKGIIITSIMEGGPSDKAGLQPGDIIQAVGDKDLKGEASQTVWGLITGKENTEVTLTIYRSTTNSTFTKTVTRKVINIPNVETEKLAGNIGFVRLNSFAENSGKEIQKAIKSMPGMKGWIFDLRSNGGGYITAAGDVIGLFPKAKVGYLLKDKDETYSMDPVKQKVRWNAPVSILTDAHSASASEMTVASLKDQKAATIYGQTTYGKGVMQLVFPLKDGSQLKLTVGEFTGPNGKKIQKKGIKPNVTTPIGKEVEYSHSDFLKKQLKSYNKLSSINLKATQKTITIKSSTKMNWSTMKKAKVSLLQIGGKEQSMKVQQALKKQLKLTTNKNLKPGTKYYVVLKSKTRKSPGAYAEMKVAN